MFAERWPDPFAWLAFLAMTVQTAGTPSTGHRLGLGQGTALLLGAVLGPDVN
jgi:hypothetical protein